MGVLMIASYKRNSNIAAALFLVGIVGYGMVNATMIFNNQMDDQPLVELAMDLWATATYLVAILFYLKAKGRSPAWIFLPPLLGLVVVLLLKDHCKDGQPSAAGSSETSQRVG